MASPLDTDSDTPLPLPKFKRDRNKFGQEVGPYKVKVGKKKVNLKTETYTVARERAREAFYDGKTNWEDERFYDKTAPDAPSKTSGIPFTMGDWASDLASAAESVKPDSVRTPDGREIALPTADPDAGADSPRSHANTSSAGGTSGPDAPKSSEGDSTEIPPEMVEGLIRQLAELAVEVQISGQEWLIKRYAKVQPGGVPVSAFGRVQSAKMWESQLKKWMPTDVPLPEWAVAIVLCAMFTVPHQVQNAQPLPKDVPQG